MDSPDPELDHRVTKCSQHSGATSSLINPISSYRDSTGSGQSRSAPLPACHQPCDANRHHLTFADLFAGLGGFHQALAGLGHMCVYASEIDPVLRELYWANYGLHPDGDIRLVDPATIPDHDILCAGFPCQSFSKAGRQEGFDCRENGDLISYVLRIINVKSPRYFILENVPNLERHDFGRTFAAILSDLRQQYHVDYDRLSPHQFGIPQVRDRLFIVGSLKSLDKFAFPVPTHAVPTMEPFLEASPADARPIPDHVMRCMEVWQEFLTRYPASEKLPYFPIWAMEFGADYPIEGLPPRDRTVRSLRPFHGSFGQPLSDCYYKQDLLEHLPHYARDFYPFPRWKRTMIQQNRDLYARHKDWIQPWLPKLAPFPHSLQKLEWNCMGEERNIWSHVIQVRASGLRVKRSTTAPSLVAMTTTQVPIIARERRYLTPRECARLQSMSDEIMLPDAPTRAFKALGNSVNVTLVREIARSLLSTHDEPRRRRDTR